jgi:hypothetical protein
MQLAPASVWIKADRLHPWFPARRNASATSTADGLPWNEDSGA